MGQKQKTDGHVVGTDEMELVAALLEASKQLGSQRSVSAPVWNGMLKRQQLGQRSLQSSVRMSGPVK